MFIFPSDMDLGWKKQWLVLLGGILVLLSEVLGTDGCFEEQKRALLDFKASYSHQSMVPSWVDDPKTNCCAWERVTCDSSSGHVIGLSLEGLTKNFSGRDELREPVCFSYTPLALNWSMFLYFKDLTTLNLSNNCFDHFVPKEDYKRESTLKKLKTLDLSLNFFNKSIMELVSALQSLKNLDLAHNMIEGPFPIKELSLLEDLEQLDVSGNQLYSHFSTKDYRSMSILKKLKTLDLSSNNFNQSIMEFVSAHPLLKNLDLSYNQIGGPFSIKAFANLSDLEVLKIRASFHEESFPNQGLCEMRKLQELDVSANEFKGTLDICLGNLTSLRILDLSYNSLTGSIPTPLIARLTSLEYLSLSSNNFEGLFTLNVFAKLSKLKGLELNCEDSKTFQVETENPPWKASFQLEHLKISHCQVNLPTKIIPTFLSYQNNLSDIDLSSNNLVGMFPYWLLMNNPKLEVMYLTNNSFIGPLELPFDSNHRMDQLHVLDLSSNKFQGELPNNMGFLFPHLKYFDVSNNMLDGHIPASIGEMSHLVGLILENNNFSGKVPQHILNGCISLKYLVMDNNQLNGTLLDGIGKLGLSILSASRNNFEGPITKEICQLELEILDLSYNKFFGAIPSCFKMPRLILFLQGNNLSGKIPEPEALQNYYNMWGIDLSYNKFTGTIPENIYGFPELKFLLLAGNQLQGQLSSHICQLESIDILDLSHNNFTGSIPSCFNHLWFERLDTGHAYEAFPLSNSWNGPTKVTYDFAEVQFITKSVPLSYKGNILLYMSALDLSSNQFTGEIPHEIGDLPGLHSLNLSHNSLNGPIPQTFQKLQNIESLDLSNNNLSGQIPLQLQDLHSLSIFNVSCNNLSGKAPEKGQFGTFDESSYRGNPYLTWSNSNKGNLALPPPPIHLNDGEKNNSAIDFTSFYWTFAASYVMILLVLATTLCINPHWRRVWFYFIEGCLLKCFGQFLEDAFY